MTPSLKKIPCIFMHSHSSPRFLLNTTLAIELLHQLLTLLPQIAHLSPESSGGATGQQFSMVPFLSLCISRQVRAKESGSDSLGEEGGIYLGLHPGKLISHEHSSVQCWD